MAEAKGSKGKPATKPETKAQRADRRDQQFGCGHCSASYDSAVTLGQHVASAHPMKAASL